MDRRDVVFQRGLALSCVVITAVSGSFLFFGQRTVEGVWLDATFLVAILVATVVFSRMLATGAIGSMERHLQRERQRSGGDHRARSRSGRDH